MLIPIPAQAEPPLSRPRILTFSANGLKAPGYSVRLPWGHDVAHAAPLVVLLPEPGKKTTDALRGDDWETVADRWGIVLLSPTATDKEAITSILGVAQRQMKLDPARIYIYGDERTALLSSLPEVAAVTGRRGREKAGEAWKLFDRQTRQVPLPDATRTHRITLVVTDLRSSAGQVAVSLWNRKEGFGGDDKNAVHSAVAPIIGGQATLTFSVRDAGDYAALVLHDRNRNGKMDTSLGYPLEGFGASGNPRVRFGAPGWDECRFTVASSDKERRIVIKAVYLTPE